MALSSQLDRAVAAMRAASSTAEKKSEEEALGITDIPREDIHVNVLGINHFTWFDRAAYRNHDLFPIYKEYVDKHYEEGYDEPEHN